MFFLKYIVLLLLVINSAVPTPSLAQYEVSLQSYFSTISSILSADSIGLTYFVANASQSTNFTSYFDGNCFSITEKLYTNPNPPTSRSLWRIAGITKVYVAAAIFQLVEAGLVKLSDPASKYIPELEAELKSSLGREVNILDLLQHTTGLEDRLFGQITNDIKSADTESISVRKAYTTYMDKPGETIAYSNLGVSILGAVVERVSRKLLNNYLRDMLSPIYQEQGLTLDPKQPGFTKYISENERLQNVCFSRSPLYEPMASSSQAPNDLIATVEDLARFMAAVVTNSSALFKYPHTFEQYRSLEGNGKLFRQGFAKMWEVIEHKGVQIYTKVGSLFEFHAIAWFVPSLNEGGAITMSGGAPLTATTVIELLKTLHPGKFNQQSTLSRFERIQESDALKAAIAKIPTQYTSQRISSTGFSKFLYLFGYYGTIKILPDQGSGTSLYAEFFGKSGRYVPVDVPGISADYLAFVDPETESFFTVRFSGPVLSLSSSVVELTIKEMDSARPITPLNRTEFIITCLSFEIISLVLAVALGIMGVVIRLHRRFTTVPSNVYLQNSINHPRSESDMSMSTIREALKVMLSSIAALTGLFSIGLLILVIVFTVFLRRYIFLGAIAPVAVFQAGLLFYTVVSLILVVVTIISVTISSKDQEIVGKFWIGLIICFGISVIMGTVGAVNLNLLSFKFW